MQGCLGAPLLIQHPVNPTQWADCHNGHGRIAMMDMEGLLRVLIGKPATAAALTSPVMGASCAHPFLYPQWDTLVRLPLPCQLHCHFHVSRKAFQVVIMRDYGFHVHT